MKCSACQHDNDPGTKFCEECGNKLIRVCSGCGVELKPTTKFCPECGVSTAATVPTTKTSVRSIADYTPKHLADKILQSKSALEGERKQVTVLFADIQGSMQLATQLDPEQWHTLLERYFAILADAVHRFEGTVNQYTGDGIMALFGAPIAHEDHAQRACYAALQARDALRAFADELRVREGLNFGFRLGINSGDVVVGKIGDDLRMDYTAQGATVGIAQRVEQLAAAGCVYLSGDTASVVSGYFALRSLGDTALKGFEQPVALFELVGIGGARSRLDVAIERGLSRFVGRASEMQTLQAALEHAERGHGQAVGIVGEPGLGKSRLCYEFVTQCRARGLPVYEAHCPAHGKNIPYLPILELLRNFFGVRVQDDNAQARKQIAGTLLLLDADLQEGLPVLFEFLGVADPGQPLPPMDAQAKQRQLYELVHRVIRAQDAQGQLSVFLIDDLHWVDAASNGFVNQLVAAAEGHRALVVLNFRPEYEAAFAGKGGYQQLPLMPLGEGPLRELIADRLGTDETVGALAEQIFRWTGGNPFYTEELIHGLVEAGALAGSQGRYRLTTRVAEITVPTSVQAVLAARIDRLPETAKRLLQTAAVIGKEFSGLLLEAVSDLAGSDYESALAQLKARDFIFERALYPVFEYAFKHPLTHEVAYGSQLAARRAQVHAAVARAVEVQAGNKVDEQAALLAHHCAQAGEPLAAARWYRRAAEWIGPRNYQTAFGHWRRALELTRGDDDPEAISLLALAYSNATRLAVRVGMSGEETAALFEEGCRAVERAGDQAAAVMLRANYGLGLVVNLGFRDDYFGIFLDAIRIADRTDDIGLAAGVRAPVAWGYLYCGLLVEAERVADETIALVADDIYCGFEVFGNSPLLASRNVRLHAIGQSRDPNAGLIGLLLVRQRAEETGFLENAIFALFLELELRYALGRFDDAYTRIRMAEQWARNKGFMWELITMVATCDALLGAEDWQVLRANATAALEQIREQGLAIHAPRFRAHLGIAELARGNASAAREAALAGVQGMRDMQAVWNPHSYAVLARAQLALAEPTSAISETLDEYEAVLQRTGFHIYDGEMHDLRARLAAREGHEAERSAALARAHDCYTRFGMTERAGRVDGMTRLSTAD